MHGAGWRLSISSDVSTYASGEQPSPALIMSRDITLLFSTRIIRLFCYGFLSVVLALYLAEAGLTEGQIGLLFTLTLVGDALISLWLTTSADRFGRKRTLILGALLMAGAGIAFVLTRNLILLIIAAIVGVISPSGNEIGPFLSVEQAGLTQLDPQQKTDPNFCLVQPGRFVSPQPRARWQAAGSRRSCKTMNGPRSKSYRVVLIGYALGGFLLLCFFST